MQIKEKAKCGIEEEVKCGIRNGVKCSIEEDVKCGIKNEVKCGVEETKCGIREEKKCDLGGSMEELYRENSKVVYHFLLSLCHDAALAEDLTQETFLKAYQSLDRYDGSCKLSTWLCQIARHLYYQYLAKRKREIPVETVDADKATQHLAQRRRTEAGVRTGQQDRTKGTEEMVINRLELIHVLKEMQKLPDAMREVIYLRTTADLSFREIGEILGRSENWARVNFYRGKEMLIRAAKDAEWEEK